jgi:ClpP class serine protease
VLTPSPVDPTPEQLVAGAYSSALSFANQIKAAVTAGAVAPDDALVVAAQATVQAAFAAIQPALTDQQVALDAAVSSAASALALKKAVG